MSDDDSDGDGDSKGDSEGDGVLLTAKERIT